MAKKKRNPSGPEAEQPGTGDGSGPTKPSKRRRTTVPHEELVPGTELTATRKGLTEHGYAVDVAFDGEEELDWPVVADFDIIILDVNYCALARAVVGLT